MNNRIAFLDIAKGILIILVVVGHVFQETWFYRFIDNFHIMGFYFISGMLLHHSKALQRPYAQVLKSKVQTLLIPLLFFEVFGVIRDLIRFGTTQSLAGFIHNTLTLQFNNGVLWFLFTLFAAELIVIPILKHCTDSKWLAVFAVLFLTVSFLMPRTGRYLLYVVRILRALFFLIAGYLLCAPISKPRYALGTACFALVLVVTALHLSVHFITECIQYMPFYVLNSLCGICFVLNLSMLPIWGRIMEKIGKNSLTIYGTHSLYYVVFGERIGIADFTKTPLSLGVFDILLVGLAEIATIFILNRFMPFFIGRKKTKPARKQ